MYRVGQNSDSLLVFDFPLARCIPVLYLRFLFTHASWITISSRCLEQFNNEHCLIHKLHMKKHRGSKRIMKMFSNKWAQLSCGYLTGMVKLFNEMFVWHYIVVVERGVTLLAHPVHFCCWIYQTPLTLICWRFIAGLQHALQQTHNTANKSEICSQSKTSCVGQACKNNQKQIHILTCQDNNSSICTAVWFVTFCQPHCRTSDACLHADNISPNLHDTLPHAAMLLPSSER